MYYPGGMKARVSLVQWSKPNSILALTQDSKPGGRIQNHKRWPLHYHCTLMYIWRKDRAAGRVGSGQTISRNGRINSIDDGGGQSCMVLATQATCTFIVRWIIGLKLQDPEPRQLEMASGGKTSRCIRVVHGSDEPAGRVTILPDFGGSGRVSTSDFIDFYWFFLCTWIDMNLRFYSLHATFALTDFLRYLIYNN